MKTTDLPPNGTFSSSEFDNYEWRRSAANPNEIILIKLAECENPEYEAHILFPNGVISRKQIDKWEIGIAAVDQNGGEQDLNSDYIDQFDPLFDHFFEKYGQSKQIII